MADYAVQSFRIEFVIPFIHCDQPLLDQPEKCLIDLTSAAQFLLNEADQQTPIVIIRGAEIEFTENPQTTTEMSPEECLYMNIFSKYLLKKDKK